MEREDVMREGGSLPPGWVWTTLGAITDTTRMRADPQDHPDARFIGMEHVEAHTMRLLGTIPAREMHSSAERFKPGDVLYGRLRPYLNKVLSPDFAGLCSGEFIIFRKVPHLENRYLQYFLNSTDFVSFASHLNAGDRPRVNFEQLADYPFPLPPLREQRCIVGEIEKQFTRLDAGVAALKRVQTNLKRYRASVLKAACEGWLAPQDPNDEPADRLLARILTKRRVKWEAEHPGKKYVEPAAPVTDGLPKLPARWCWASVGQITDTSSGRAFKESEYVEEGVKLLQIANVSFGKIRFDEAIRMPEDYLEKYPDLVLKAGDVLMALNRPILSGELKIGILQDQDAPAILYQRVGRFDFYAEAIKPHFFYFAQSPLFVSKLKISLQGVDQPFVNKPTLLGMMMPLPPLPEQHRIVAEVERRLSVVAEQEATIAANLARAGRLRQAVLKRAFEGRLVAQDANE